MRVVVTGSTGQLGRAVVRAASVAGHEVTGLARSGPEPCDLTDPATARQRIGAARPDLVIHAAGATDVDGCERDPDVAQRLNVDLTRHVADAATATGAHLVYVSTNHVFDGTADAPYQEDDTPAPRSAYGVTKRAGEQLVGPEATIVRTAWLWSPRGPGIVPAIVAAARAPGPLRFTPDEVAQPTCVDDLAPVLLGLGATRRAGSFHVVAEGAVSAADLARSVLSELGDDPSRVIEVPAADLPGRLALRPRNGALATARIVDAGLGLPHHLVAVGAFVHGGRTPA